MSESDHRLSAVPEEMIGQDNRHHGLSHRHCADANARIVPPYRHNIRLMPLRIDGLARRQDGRCWFDGETRNDGLAGGNAAKDPARMIGQKDRPAVLADAHFVGIFLA